MARLEFNISPGRQLHLTDLTTQVIQDGNGKITNAGLNEVLFQQVSVDGLPYFMFRPYDDSSKKWVDAATFPDPPVQNQETTDDGKTHHAPPSYPVIANVLRYAIPRGMKRLTHLMEGVEVSEEGSITEIDHAAGLPIARIDQGTEAVSIPVLHHPVLDDTGPERRGTKDGESLSIDHFCTGAALAGASCAGPVNCPRIPRTKAINLSDGSVESFIDKSTGDYICVSFPLKKFLNEEFGDGSGGYKDYFDQSPVYRLLVEYLDFENLSEKPIRMVATYLPDQTLVWNPVKQADWYKTHLLLTKGIAEGTRINGTPHESENPYRSDEVLFSVENLYIDKCDMWLGFPCNLIACTKWKDFFDNREKYVYKRTSP
jgi:hypothetical protein